LAHSVPAAPNALPPGSAISPSAAKTCSDGENLLMPSVYRWLGSRVPYPRGNRFHAAGGPHHAIR
jgi:hypothetical protein